MDIQILPIEQVKPYNKNPRVNAEAVRAVKKSLEEFGFQQPLVVDDKFEIIRQGATYEDLIRHEVNLES